MNRDRLNKIIEEELLWLDEDRIRETTGGKEEWSALDVLALGYMPPGERLWVVLREEFLDTQIQRGFGCRIAESALAQLAYPNPALADAAAVKRSYYTGGAMGEELAAAQKHAWDAAWDTVRGASLNIGHAKEWNLVAHITAWIAAPADTWDFIRIFAHAAAKFCGRPEIKEAEQINVLWELLTGPDGPPDTLCRNCRCFVQHFQVSGDGAFAPNGFGHCGLTGEPRNHDDDGCDSFGRRTGERGTDR
jgi:hypothetical protein